MEVINVLELRPGTILEGPLYDARGKLLLAQGIPLTAEMSGSLKRSGLEHAYLGEWDEDEVRWYESGGPVADLAGQARDFARHVEETEDEADVAVELAPAEKSFEAETDTHFQEHRPEKRFEQWRSLCDEGTNMVEDIVQGDMPPHEIRRQAERVVDQLMNAFATDMSLLVNFTNVKQSKSYLYRHSLNTAVLSINIAAALGYDRRRVGEVGLAALLKDIGMTMVPEKVLNAPRALSPAEFHYVRQHPAYSLYVLSRVPGLPHIVRFIAYQHHERADGSGYPRGRRKERIHPYAQIVAVADAYDALTTDRPWRKAYHPYRAMEILIREANRGKYDGDIVRGILRFQSLFPIGTLVRLNTGEVARVVHMNEGDVDRPIIRVLFDASGARLRPPATVNLNEDYFRSVEAIIENDVDLSAFDGF